MTTINPTQLTITFDIDEPDHDVIHIWAALHANHMLDELWHAGIIATLTGIDVHNPHHDQPCSPSHAEP
jgi:hypothetical protein